MPTKLIKTYWSFLLLGIFSCSTTKHYQTLSFFFDGVPAPETKSSKVDSVKNIALAKPLRATIAKDVIDAVKSFHPDYRKKTCEKCHSVDHAYRLKDRQPQLCYQCHEPFETKFEKIHGPVAAGFCSACHKPHQSEYKGLLNMTIRNICQHCHEAGDVSKNEAHKELSEKECLDCHDSHGGRTANLIKDEIKVRKIQTN